MKRMFLIVVLIVVFSLAACQPTPGAEPVPNKGDNKLEEAIRSTPVPTEGGFVIPSLDVPEHWSEDIEIVNSLVHIDADILYQDIAYPVYVVRDMPQFDGKKLKALIDLFVDARRWLPLEASREELLKRLESAMLGEWIGTDPATGEDIYAPYEGQQEEIAEIINRLSELDPGENWEDIESIEDIPSGAGYISDGKRQVYYSQNGKHFHMRENKDSYTMSELMAAQSEFFSFGDGIPTGKIPEPSMSSERAVELANEVLAEIGLDDTLSPAYTRKERTSLDGVVTGIGWDVVCLLHTKGAKMYDDHEYSYSAQPFAQEGYDDYAEYRPSTASQLLVLRFEDEVLTAVTWDNPQEIVSVASPAVELMSFDEIKARTKNRLKFGLAYTEIWPTGMTIYIEEIAVSYLKAAKADVFNEYYWVPVWAIVFRVDDPVPLAPGILFINAIDGTFVAFNFFS